MASDSLRVVLVTPEKTLLDAPVTALRFPLFDGQIGILPKRAPMVGRLGHGELVLHSDGRESSYFIDGGFVQVKGPVVSILTSRAVKAEELSYEQAEEEFMQAQQSAAYTDAEFDEKFAAVERARSMLNVASKPR